MENLTKVDKEPNVVGWIENLDEAGNRVCEDGLLSFDYRAIVEYLMYCGHSIQIIKGKMIYDDIGWNFKACMQKDALEIFNRVIRNKDYVTLLKVRLKSPMQRPIFAEDSSINKEIRLKILDYWRKSIGMAPGEEIADISNDEFYRLIQLITKQEMNRKKVINDDITDCS